MLSYGIQHSRLSIALRNIADMVIFYLLPVCSPLDDTSFTWVSWSLPLENFNIISCLSGWDGEAYVYDFYQRVHGKSSAAGWCDLVLQ